MNPYNNVQDSAQAGGTAYIYNEMEGRDMVLSQRKRGRSDEDRVSVYLSYGLPK